MFALGHLISRICRYNDHQNLNRNVDRTEKLSIAKRIIGMNWCLEFGLV